MKIDLCKLLGVEEGEEFKRDDSKIYYKYRVYNNIIQHFDEVLKIWEYSTLSINTLVTSEIIKLPKKKEFTDDELCILRNIKSEINTLGRNINGTIYVTSDYGKSYLKLFNNLFQSLDIGEEIIIDDYVERGAENE